VPTICRLPTLSAPFCRRALKNMGLFFKRDRTLQGAYESLPPHMGWQRFVGSLNCHVSFAKRPHFCRALLQKGPERARARAKGGERRKREKKKESESETERLGEREREGETLVWEPSSLETSFSTFSISLSTCPWNTKILKKSITK